jgi:hypothetical protein
MGREEAGERIRRVGDGERGQKELGSRGVKEERGIGALVNWADFGRMQNEGKGVLVS